MKLIQTTDAEGAVLCHDITRIIKGVSKDAVFRKGHIVTKEDIPVLLSAGKDQLYVWEKEEGMRMMRPRFCARCAGAVIWSGPRQRKARLNLRRPATVC